MPDCHLSQASMENLLDETGQGALHNVERRGPDLRNRLSQHSLSFGGQGTEFDKHIVSSASRHVAVYGCYCISLTI